MRKFFLSLIIFSIVSHCVIAQTVFTYRSPESENDSRYDYDNALLKLALDKTIETHGEYILKASPIMNYARMLKSLEEGTFENPMFKKSATNELTQMLDYVNFPVDLGIVGYRVFFVSPEIINEFENEETLSGIKKYSIIQGNGWSDVQILRNTGFTVTEVPKYESLFFMISGNRADLLPRGINEVKS